jgi:integrase
MHKLWKHPNGTFYALHGPRLRARASLRTKDRKEADIRFAQFVIENSNQLPETPLVSDILDVYEKSGELRAPNALRYSVKALKEGLGNLKPEHLVEDTISKYARERGASDGTILRDIGVLRAALAHTLKRDQRPEIANPVKSPKARQRWLTRTEANALIGACRQPHLRLFVILGIMTGGRSAALLELQWSQVNLDTGLVDLGEGHGNKRRAVIPMNPDLRRALVAAKEMSCTDFVVEYGGRQVGTVKNGFEAACGRAKLEGVTPHILRHTCATWLVKAKISYEEIGKMLGDTKETIERVYGHHDPDYLKDASNALQLSAA